jgi:hypothetical protein
MKSVAILFVALASSLGMGGSSMAADSCKECQEFLKVCLQAHSKAACQTDYAICKKHCREK